MVALKQSAKQTNQIENIIFEKSFPVEGKTFKNAGNVSTQVKAILQEMFLPAEEIRRAAIVTYEAEINICSYAEHGVITLRLTPEKIIIDSTDKGQGIADINLAMEEGYSTATRKIWQMGFGAGMGLSNMKKYSDSFEISSEVGIGTNIRMIINI
ncbi:MAG TPA: ATP-binding protein [Syntrophorhabdaceae bacterium]|nr:ATP-binding protein [Syntrophorhabdaceae bacterium]